MSLSRFVIRLLSATLIVSAAGLVCGQDYPNKPIRIVTSAAGGGADLTARLIAQGIAGPLGQSVIVDNRISLAASEAVSKAPPDGYTMLVGGASVWIFPLLQKAPYDVMDFSPISLTDRSVNIVAVHPSVPVRSVKELIALAKARPGELNYGSAGSGGSNHLGGELFKSLAGINIVHVAYKGGAAAIVALISGEVQLVIFDAGVITPHVKSGKVRALAVTSAQSSALAPGLPTVAATGLPGYEWVGTTGTFVPAKTPVAIINRLNQEIVRVLGRPEVKERFFNAGVEAVGTSSEELATTIRSDTARISKVIKDAGIKVQN